MAYNRIMKKKIIGTCPVCQKSLLVSELSCPGCQTKISGEFSLSKFDYLSASQQEFALVFLKNGGNIKAIEKELNISYPTVRKNLDEVIEALGFQKENLPLTRREILRMLKDGEINFDQAEKMLEGICDE